MRVAYFSNQFAQKSGHGIATYAHHLYEELSKNHLGIEIIPVAAWSDRQKDNLDQLIERTGLQILRIGQKATPLLWSVFNYPKIEQLIEPTIDIVHAVSLGYPIATRKPFVVTVHDIGPLTHPEFFTNKPSQIMEQSLKQAVKQAKSLICVSQATADDLCFYVSKRYKTNVRDRISVIHEGVSPSFFDETKLNLNDSNLDFSFEDTPFILAVGKLSPRKNLTTVIEALSLLKNEIPHHLITVGGDGWDSNTIKEQAHRKGVANKVHFMGYVLDHTLKALYQKASVFVYPSLFEGFGLTVLEAMASGCPVITSNSTSLPEVAGDAAILINPLDVKEMADAIHSLCQNPKLHNNFKQEGIKRARKFSWANCAEHILELYKKHK